MNEKVKTRLYLLIGILGIAFALAVKLILQEHLSDSQVGAMIGV